MGMNGQLHALTTVHRGKEPQPDSLYQLNNSLGGPRANVDALEKRQMSVTSRKWTAVRWTSGHSHYY